MKHSQYDDDYFDHSDDLIARVRRAKEAAQRKMEEFGDPSEYDITIIRGQGPEEPLVETIKQTTQSTDPVSIPKDDEPRERQTTVELIEGDLRPPTEED
ncbi:MAG TPA: hypothetical protein VFP59_20340 [Candidatus Angelobacter sp.]|nr:hypothetical protein [Candidatus Angelobacter sp.]